MSSYLSETVKQYLLQVTTICVCYLLQDTSSSVFHIAYSLTIRQLMTVT